MYHAVRGKGLSLQSYLLECGTRVGELGGVICNNVCIKCPDVLGDSGDHLERRHPCPDYSSRDAQCFQNISSS